jgi:hypothetical protein
MIRLFFFVRAVILMVLLSIIDDAIGQQVAESLSSKAEIWKKIAPYFSPPDSLRNVLGHFRSPLVFYDGRRVRDKQDWAERRSEIKARWHELMGEWPALIKDQQLQLLDSVRRDGIVRYRVRFRWTPEETTEGYLLIPDEASEEKRPAVITVFYEPETAIGEGMEYRDFALQLAKRGFVALSIGTTYATKEKTYSLYYPDIDNATVQPLSMLAYAAANAWNALSTLPVVDSTRIGIMGHSFSEANGRCLLHAFTKSSAVPYGRIRELYSSGRVKASIIGNRGISAIIRNHGESGV